MNIKRLLELRNLLKADDDIAKVTITVEELTEIWKYQQRLVQLWSREYSVLETINAMIADIENPRDANYAPRTIERNINRA